VERDGNPPTAGDGGPLARFNKHRDRFELIASVKHQRGQFEEEKEGVWWRTY
jgi:hypothetical protein